MIKIYYRRNYEIERNRIEVQKEQDKKRNKGTFRFDKKRYSKGAKAKQNINGE